MTEIIKNWVGIETHYTDSYVHWSEKEPEKKMLELREYWDKVVKNGADIDALKKLLDAAYQSGSMDEYESHCGPEL